MLEVIIAVTILGIILLTVYGTLSRTIESKEHAEEVAQLDSVGREAVLRMGDEIEASLSPDASPGAVFQGVGSGGGEFTDQIRFAMSVRPPFGPLVELGAFGGRVLVTYSLDQVEGRTQDFLLRRDQVPIDALRQNEDGFEPTGDEAQQELAMMVVDHVAGLRYNYLDGVTGQWVEEWDSTQEDFLDRLPIAVAISLYLYDSTGNIRDFSTIVDLPLANFGKPTPTPEPEQS